MYILQQFFVIGYSSLQLENIKIKKTVQKDIANTIFTRINLVVFIYKTFQKFVALISKMNEQT